MRAFSSSSSGAYSAGSVRRVSSLTGISCEGSMRGGCGVRSGIQQAFDLRWVGHANLHHPTVLKGRSVDAFGRVQQWLVNLRDLAGDGGVQVGNGFYGLDGSERRAFDHFTSRIRQIEIHDVSQLRLGEVRDADHCRVAFDADPLVGGGIAEVTW